jgi:hypothetical protein
MLKHIVTALALAGVASPVLAMTPMPSPAPHGAMHGSTMKSHHAMKSHDAMKSQGAMKHASSQSHDAMHGAMSSPAPKATP